MKTRLIAALALALTAAPAWAQEPAQAQPSEHEVQPGETLWDLAGQYLNDPARWRVLYDANTSLLTDPDLILPGQRLVIPEGTAPGLRVTIRQGGTDPDPLGRNVAAPAGVARTVAQEADRTVFRQRAAPTAASDQSTVVREPGIEQFPVKPGEFSASPFLGDPATLTVAGRFLRSLRTDPAMWGGAVTSHPQDDLFLAYVEGVRPQPGDRLVLVEVGRAIRGAPEGHRLIRPRGVIRVTALNADAIEGRLEAQYGPVLPGLLAVPEPPMPEFSAPESQPISTGFDLEGRILEFVDERPLYGRADVAILDLGRSSGVRPGDVFTAFIPARATDAGVEQERTLPPEPVAELRVIRVTDGTATAKVDRLTLPRLRPDLPVRRVRKMP